MWWLREWERQVETELGCMAIIVFLLGIGATLTVQKACQYRVHVDKAVPAEKVKP